MVMAHESLSGNCSLEHIPLVLDQNGHIGTIDTVPLGNVGPEYESKDTMTAVGRSSVLGTDGVYSTSSTINKGNIYTCG